MAVLGVAVALFLGGVSYGFVWTILPVACPAGVSSHVCLESDAVHAYWSVPVWIVSSIAFGVVTRRRTFLFKLGAAVVVVLLIIAIMQLALPIAGFYTGMDTL